MSTSTPGPRLLNLGCGRRVHPEWVNVDLAPQVPGVVQCDLSRGIPFPDASFDVVYHSSMIEHFRRPDARKFIAECLRVLKPGGLIRVATPNLERVCELYLQVLRALPDAGAQGEANLEWMTLELYDQTVREHVGGMMLDFLRQNPLPNEAFVLERIGQEGRELLAALRSPDAAHLPGTKPITTTDPSARALAIGKFRLSGEVHHWMYDRVSLARLLTDAGFLDPVVRGASESALPDWTRYGLDTNPDGTVTKPDTFCMEARKSTTASAPVERVQSFTDFETWVHSLERYRGLLSISPERAYAHAEDQYDTQYGVTAPEPADGQGLCALLKTHDVDTSGPALEIGCGTGRLTFGVAQHYPGPDFLITDPSPAFLRLTQSQFGSGVTFPTRLHYAVLNADDLGRLPPEMFSLITMRSTLHHILGWQGFIADCARTLRPGGALVMGAEPCEYGYVLMGAIGQSIAPVLQAAGVELLPAWKKQLATFLETIKFYCRHDLDKATAEDKHLFNPHEMADVGAAHGLQLRFFPNATFADYAPPFEPEFVSFSIFFLNYLKFCILFDEDLLKAIRRHLKPQMKYVDDCYRNHVGPAITGVFLLKKNA